MGPRAGGPTSAAGAQGSPTRPQRTPSAGPPGSTSHSPVSPLGSLTTRGLATAWSCRHQPPSTGMTNVVKPETVTSASLRRSTCPGGPRDPETQPGLSPASLPRHSPACPSAHLPGTRARPGLQAQHPQRSRTLWEVRQGAQVRPREGWGPSACFHWEDGCQAPRAGSQKRPLSSVCAGPCGADGGSSLPRVHPTKD